MNVQGIWSGEYYAYVEFGGRSFPMHAKKGRCIRTEKVKPVYGERAKAFAVLMRVNEETGEDIGEVRVRARDVVDEWDSYANERRGIIRERNEKIQLETERREQLQREMQAAREERLARQEAIENQEREKRERFIEVFTQRTGLPKDALISVTPNSVTLDRTMLDFWLSGKGT